ncbi:MAG: DUF6531 domain-containing protein [Panacagrimonas sp.]
MIRFPRSVGARLLATIASASCLYVLDIGSASAAEQEQLQALPAYWGDDQIGVGAGGGSRSLVIDGSSLKGGEGTIPAYLSGIPRNAAVIPKAAPLNDACEPTPDDPRDLSCNPVSIRTGNKFRTDLDFRAQGEFPLELVRTYNRSNELGGMFGRYWTSTFTGHPPSIDD